MVGDQTCTVRALYGIKTLAKSSQAAERELQAKSEAVLGYLPLNSSIWAREEKSEENH